jgi:hypothetical protein
VAAASHQLGASSLLTLFSSAASELTDGLILVGIDPVGKVGGEHVDNNQVRFGFDCQFAYPADIVRQHDGAEDRAALTDDLTGGDTDAPLEVRSSGLEAGANRVTPAVFRREQRDAGRGTPS